MDLYKNESLINNAFEQAIEALKDLIAIPSISAPAFDQAPLEQSARYLRDILIKLGAQARIAYTVDKASGNKSRPAVLAQRIIDDCLPTVLLYAHHDVQPVGQLSAWKSDPFVPEVRSGRLYGRGSADDGAGLALHLGTLAAYADNLPVNLKIFIEGEEEIGSPTFRSFLQEHREDLEADVIVVADSANWEIGKPGLTSSLRGVLDCEVTLKVLENPLHSGVFGGPIIDALTLMCRLIATLHNPDGSVALKGLVGSDTSQVDYTEADFRRQAAVVETLKLAGSGSIASRLWNQSAISVIGIDATDVDSASNTLISQCRAKISLRIAPGEDPERALNILRTHLFENVPFGAQISVVDGDLGPAYKADLSSPVAKMALQALSEGFDHPAVGIGMGGSIPFILDFQDLFPQAQILVTGVEDPACAAHGPNESVHLEDLKKALVSQIRLLDLVSKGIS